MQASQKRIVRKLIETAGHATQSLGVGRVTGQIYACLYLAPEPQSLDQITQTLGISKGSASMCVRQLEQWGALEKVWVHGDRKDYYQAKETFGRILKNTIADLAGKRIEMASNLLEEAEKELEARSLPAGKAGANDKFIRDRLRKLRNFQEKISGLWQGIVLKILVG